MRCGEFGVVAVVMTKPDPSDEDKPIASVQDIIEKYSDHNIYAMHVLSIFEQGKKRGMADIDAMKNALRSYDTMKFNASLKG